MPRKTMTPGRISLTALFAVLLVLGAAPGAAQAQNYSNSSNSSDDDQPPTMLETAANAAGTAAGAAAAVAYDPQSGQPIYGYNPITGQPIFTTPDEDEEEDPDAPKAKRVMYDELSEDVDGTDTLPSSLKDLENLPRENTLVEGETGMPLDVRLNALREAGVSYGARGGLAFRTYYTRRELELRARELDKVYDFRQLLIPAPSGFLIEPPVINESLNAMLIEGDGQQAAVSDAIYNIVNNAKIVSTSRTWRNYLEREWGAVEPPPDILRPENAEERKVWIENVKKGWEEGIRQADEIFRDDLHVLMADFQGMVRYRVLLTQGMVSPPYALQVDRGVTGDGNQMRVGDRAVQITGVPELITGSEQWQPASR